MARKLVVLAATLALATLIIGVSAAYAGTVQVPIQGSYSGTVTFTNDGGLWSGTGVSSYLGASTNQGVIVITGPAADCPGGFTNIHTETFTAANGDTLKITSYDVACPIAPGIYHGQGEFRVTGGTGRFSNVTGTGTLDGYADFNQGTFRVRLRGMISPPMR